MKRALVSVLRLTMFVGVLALLPFISKGPIAQLAHQCQTFFTESIDCPSCGCANPGAHFYNDIVAVDKPTGIQSILNTNWSCGAPVAGCNATFAGPYPQGVRHYGCCIVT